MQRVQVLLKSLMLRRQKDSVVDGQIVCNLPPTHLSKEAVEFSDDEMAVYKALESKAQITLNKYIKEDAVSGKCAQPLLNPESDLTLSYSQLRKHPRAPSPPPTSLLPPPSDQGPESASYREYRRRRLVEPGTGSPPRRHTPSKNDGGL
jgi:hypothetical protein